MADADDELEEIRERKRRELTESGDGTGNETAGTAPDEPVAVESREEYEELVEAHDVVLVDFYADWCGPCKMLAPVVEELAAETDAAVLKVDIDAHQGLARDFGVQSVPTLFVYSGGEVAERVVGVKQKHELQSLLEAAA